MNKKFDFNKLFIFEMANNHCGNLKHGLNIIIQTVVSKQRVRPQVFGV